MVYKWGNLLQHILLPGHCCLCLAPDPGGLGLCSDCCDDLPWLTQSCCPRCALPVPVPGRVCGACQSHPPQFDQCSALFHYRPPVDRLVLQLKFGQGLHLSRLFAALLAKRLRDTPRPDCIIPVPLHPSRQRERGFNQAIEIARPLAKRLCCRLDAGSCIRSRPTPPQSQLSSGQRRRNLRDAFTLRNPLKARHVALVDDVMTTGSTLNALAGMLRRAGVARIDVWVCARTGGDV